MAVSEYERGQWECAEQLMHWLNEQDERLLPKSFIYGWAMRFRPKKPQRRKRKWLLF